MTPGFAATPARSAAHARLEGRVAIGRFPQRFPGYCLTGCLTQGGRARFRGFLQAPFSIA